MKYLRFLYKKIKTYSILDLIRLEIESLVFGIFCMIPTTLGVILRAIACKFLLKKNQGFSWIQPRVIIIHSDRIITGENLGINSGTYLNGIGGIDIGNNVLIGPNVTISSGKHTIEGKFPPIFSRASVPQKIIIEDDVWIGAGAVILPGVRLAKGTVVGANAVVLNSTNPYEVVAGIPAKILYVR